LASNICQCGKPLAAVGGERSSGPSAGEDRLWNIFAYEPAAGELRIRKPRKRFEPMRLQTRVLEPGKEGLEDIPNPLEESWHSVVGNIQRAHFKSSFLVLFRYLI
jgi:hypothetical protein